MVCLVKNFLILILSFLAGSHSRGDSCFERHINEAIEVNKTRMPVCSQLSDGRSERLSKQWIFSEKAVLKTLNIFNPDIAAKIFEDAGIPIVCSGFIEMNTIPKMIVAKTSPLSFPARKIKYTRNLGWKVKSFLEKDQIFSAWNLLNQEIEKLKEEPSYNCITRHLLESSARFIAQAENFDREALAKGLPSSLPLSKKLAIWQLIGLPFAKYMDNQSAKIQLQGIPLFCNDIPAIPFHF